MKHITISAKLLRPLLKTLNRLSDAGDLIARLWVAHVFFTSGLSKIYDWNTTLVLFQNVYTTPLMPPVLAAYVGTGFELIFPVFLVLGLGGRLLVFLFFVYNIICVISYHYLWTPMGASGLQDHIMWGIILMLLMFHGCGRISLDYLIHRKYGHLLY